MWCGFGILFGSRLVCRVLLKLVFEYLVFFLCVKFWLMLMVRNDDGIYLRLVW